MTMKNQIVLVTGASRGVGKGIARGLGEAGATVYVTGRSLTPGEHPGTIGETAAEVTALGGRGIAVACDHTDDAAVAALFARIHAEHGALDVLVNNAFAVPDGRVVGPFWELPLDQWDTMHRVGLRSHYVAAWHAVPAMIARGKGGLIVNVSSFGAKIRAVSVAYGVGKAGVDRMSRDMAKDLAPHDIHAVSIWPGIVKTERHLAERLGLDSSTIGESAQFSGRAVAALAVDPNRAAKSGQALVVAELATEYGFTDVDGTTPKSLKR